MFLYLLYTSHMDTLFDRIERTDTEGADYGEPSFLYLNRTARDHFARMRDIIERWFSKYSEMHPNDSVELRNRFRSEDDLVHLSALTEFYFHNLLIGSEYLDIQIHPQIKGTSAHPDFLVSRDGTPVFIAEAVVVYGNPEGKRVERFHYSILRIVNEVESPDFLIWVDFVASDSSVPPKLANIRKVIMQNIASLDYEKVCAAYEATKELPQWIYDDGPWKIHFSASPVKEESRKTRREKKARNVGIIQNPVKWITSDDSIRRTVLKKAQKYGDQGMPLIVVANVVEDSFFCDERTILSALFGKETMTFRQYTDGRTETLPGRDHNGITLKKGGPRYTRLSGLLSLVGLAGSTIELVTPILWHHPAAKYRLDTSSLKIEHRVYDHVNDRMGSIKP